MTSELFGSLRLPVMAAPMFLISGPELVIAACRSGLAAGFPAPNARSVEDLDQWMGRIATALASGEPGRACWAVNILVHKTYERFDAEIELIKQYRPPIVITALGDPSRAYDAVRAYGGKVFTDVVTLKHAHRAVAAGVDGLILVCAGAGGHTGSLNPFGFVRAVREFWQGPLVLAGAIADGASIRAAEVLGADLAYVGSPFIAVSESLASESHRKTLVESTVDDIVASKAVTGVLANWVASSLEDAGWDRNALAADTKPDFSGDIGGANKPWKHLVSAGHAVGRIKSVLPVAEFVDGLADEYAAALAGERAQLAARGGQRIQGSVELRHAV